MACLELDFIINAAKAKIKTENTVKILNLNRRILVKIENCLNRRPKLYNKSLKPHICLISAK
jgi:hypothetical protein